MNARQKAKKLKKELDCLKYAETTMDICDKCLNNIMEKLEGEGTA